MSSPLNLETTDSFGSYEQSYDPYPVSAQTVADPLEGTFEGAPEGALEIPVEQRPSRLWPILREVIETLLLAAAIWLGVNFATARYIVEGQSMEPNLHTGQMLIVNRLTYRFGEPQRGDIIVFDYPNNPSDDYVKRIIGLPGDEVTFEEGLIYVNGQLLTEPYLSEALMQPFQGRWVVPEGAYFVLGDNRSHSSDSRAWGMLERNKIIGKAWVSYWPPQEWSIIPHYDYGVQVEQGGGS